MNFLYKLPIPLNNEEIEDLKIYLLNINSHNKLFDIKPSNVNLINNEMKDFFSNVSFLIFNKKIIFTQKKQTYYKEINILDGNFSLGFGNKETNLKEDEPEYKLFEYFNSKLNIDICIDIQKKYSFNRKKFMEENISYLNKEDQKIIKEKRMIFKKYNNGNDYEDKEYYIIQSNSTNINQCLMQFPNDKIIIQSDPINSGIFRTNYSFGFKFKIEEIIKKKEIFIKELYNKNKSFEEQESVNKNLQDIEFNRTKKNAEEFYGSLIENFFESNFFNITELIRPVNTIIENLNDKIKLEILINDLKKFK